MRRSPDRPITAVQMEKTADALAENAARCPLCGRDMIPGPSIDQHHLMPRSHGGKEAVWMHRICHQAIHALLSERELAVQYSSTEALLNHAGIRRFVAWVRKRPADYTDRSRWSRERRRV